MPKPKQTEPKTDQKIEGDRNVTAAGDMIGNTIITGDGNTVFVTQTVDAGGFLPVAIPTAIDAHLQNLDQLITRLKLSEKILFDLYRQSLPPLAYPVASANLRLILFDLANRTEDKIYGNGLTSFVKKVGQIAIDAQTRSDLEQWLAHHQPQSQPVENLPAALPQGDPQTLATCLQIELRTDPQSAAAATNKRYLVRIGLWHNGAEQNWYDEPQALTLDKIPTVLMKILASNDHRLPAKAAFEFIAPRELFNENLDRWETSAEYGMICGEHYPVVIRSLDRLLAPPSIRAKFVEKWQIKWAKLQDVLNQDADCSLLWYSPDPDFKKLGSDLDIQAIAGFVGLDAAPSASDTFKALIIAGIPVALWPQSGSLAQATLTALKTNHLALQTIAALPNWLYDVRAKATNLGASFALLWDDPTRIPQKYRDEGVCT